MVNKTSENNKRKVLVIGPGIDAIGGIPEYIRGLVKSKLIEKYDFIIFDTLKIKKRKGYVKKSRISIQEVVNSYRVVRNYLKLLDKNPHSIVHIHSSSYWGYYEKLLMAQLAKWKNQKVILHIHGGSFVQFFNKLRLKKFFLNVMSKFNSVIVLTEEMKKTIDIPNVSIVPNAVDIPEISFEYNRKKIVTFLSVSVLEERKRVGLMLEAAKILKERGKHFKLMIAGDGPEKDNIVEYISENSLDDVVEFLGVVKGEEKDKAFRNSDVFILASASDSFGIVVIEAMSYGKGIITTPVGISPQIVKNNTNGLLIEIDNLDSLVNAMDKYISSNLYNSNMIEENYRIIKDLYSWDSIVEELDLLYKG